MILASLLLSTFQVFMHPSSIPKKISDDLVSRKVDDDLLIVDQENGKIHQLNQTATFIWSLCDGKSSVEEIVKKSFENFDIDENQISKDVNTTLENLIELNLIEFPDAWWLTEAIEVATKTLDLSIFGCLVNVQVSSKPVLITLIDIYSAFKIAEPIAKPVLRYSIQPLPENSSSYSVHRDNMLIGTTENMGYLLYIFEKDLTIELQKLRSDLYFIHAGVLEWGGKGILLIAPSGTGKSTTTWALTNHGFRYLSDELAPIDLKDMTVYGYPRALGLKQRPPTYSLPCELIETESGFHLPVSALPTDVVLGPLHISAIFILGEHGQTESSIVESAPPSSAAQHIYANTLNALSHEGIGLEGAVLLAKRRPCFFVRPKHGLKQTCESIQGALAALG
jgi:hypothetical protein